MTATGALRALAAPPERNMKRVCRRLTVAAAVLVWLGALVYLLVLSRRRLPEPEGSGRRGAPVAGRETSTTPHQVSTNSRSKPPNCFWCRDFCSGFTVLRIKSL